MSHDTLDIRLATVQRNDRGKAKNVTWTWARLIDRLSKVEVDHDHTVEQYKAASSDRRAKLKDVGAFVGGPVKEGIRKRDNMLERTLVTLDIDDANAGQIDDLEFGLGGLASYEWFAYTTRSHTPEKPKFRVVLPLTRRLTAEEYGPVSRILASKVFGTVGEAMDAVDDVSFRVAQIMYWPSSNSDGEFRTIRNEGTLVNPDKVLRDFGNWQDWTQLPYSEKRGMKRPSVKKAEHPHQKRGIVGAFCRAYTVPEAIKTFLPDVYELGEDHSSKPRYTYKKGSGANGAVVEDGGLFLYSNHGTDPCSERLVNAFDLVRIHKFGELDREAGFNEDEGQPKSAPSFKAMSEEFSSEPRIAGELLKDQFDADAMFEDYDDMEDRPKAETSVFDEFEQEEEDDILAGPAPQKSTDWMTKLEREKDGSVKATVTNIALIIQNDPRLQGCIEWNAFAEEVVTRHPIKSKDKLLPRMAIVDQVNGDLWIDRHDNCVRALIEAEAGKGKKGYGLKVSDRDMRAGVDLAAAKQTFHPVRDYLDGLKWDGRSRVEHLFIEYLGAADLAYTRAIGRLMMLGAVTRVFEPGHKFDFVAILEGLQGKRKSTFIETLARYWFVEIKGDLHDRKSLVEQMQGAWIMEIPELSGFSKAEVQEIKAFISARKDKVRLSYDRRAKEFKRQCIFVGSTNDSEYLRDQTGGRRFWPVVCEEGEIDIDKLERNVDQLWAEAVHIYRDMRAKQPNGTLPLYLADDVAKGEAEVMQESRRMTTTEDAYVGKFEDWLDTPMDDPASNGMDDDMGTPKKFWRTETCALELWCEVLGGSVATYNSVAARTINQALRMMHGWEQRTSRKFGSYGNQRIYRRRGALLQPIEPIPGTESDI